MAENQDLANSATKRKKGRKEMSVKSSLSWLFRPITWLFCGKPKKQPPAPAVTKIVPKDPWLQFKEDLPAKLIWAEKFLQSNNIIEIAKKTDSTPEKVDLFCGSPLLWMEFGRLVEENGKTPLSKIRESWKLLTGTEELQRAFEVYLSSIDGFIMLNERHDHNDLRERDPGKQDKIRLENIILTASMNRITRKLGSFETLREFYWALSLIDKRASYGNSQYLKVEEEKKRLFDAEVNACGDNIEKLSTLYHSLTPCDSAFAVQFGPPDLGVFEIFCNCEILRILAKKIYKEISEKIRTETSIEELEKIDIPSDLGVYSSYSESRLLREEKWAKLYPLKKREEEEKIKSSITPIQ